MIDEKLLKILEGYNENKLDLSLITYDTTLVGDIGLSSLELIMIVCDIEKVYNVEISIDDVADFITVGDMISYLQRRA